MQFFDDVDSNTQPIAAYNRRVLASTVDTANYAQHPLPPAAHTDRTGRKTYKTTKEKKETVWPPQLEEALLEALKLYRPKSKSGRKLRRFTKRNVFISNHILKVTGVHRTPKQVGSRLQQIRESCQDDQVLKLVCCRDFPSEDEESDSIAPSPKKVRVATSYPVQSPIPKKTPSLSSVSCSSDELLSPTLHAPHTSVMETSFSGLSVCAELLPADDERGPSIPLFVDAEFTDIGLDFFINLDKSAQAGDVAPFAGIPAFPYLGHGSASPRGPPTTTLISTSLSSTSTYGAMFSVYVDGTTQVHVENTTFTPLKSDIAGDPFLFTTQFIPHFWSKILAHPSPERYTIIQDVMEFPSSRLSPSTQAERSSTCRLKFSIAYRLRRSDTSPPPLYNVCSAMYPSDTFDESVTAFPDLQGLDAYQEPSILPAFSDLPLQISHLQNDGSAHQMAAGVSLWYPMGPALPSAFTSTPTSGFTSMATFNNEPYSSLDLTSSYTYPSF